MLISEDGQPLLTNFGFSPDFEFNEFMRSQRGNEAMINCMSLQMLGSDKVSVEADVWAFGMTALVCTLPLHTRVIKVNLYRNCSLAKAQLTTFLDSIISLTIPPKGIPRSAQAILIHARV